MSNQNMGDVQAELDLIRRQLANLEAKVVLAKQASPSFSKRLMEKMPWIAAAFLISGAVFAAGEAIFIDSKGKVGIGTNAPSAELDVKGKIQADMLAATKLTAAELTAAELTATKLEVKEIYQGKGDFRLFAYDGDGKSGTAYVQARDSSKKSNIDFQFRTQEGGKVVDALKIAANGTVSIPVGLEAPGLITGALFIESNINSTEIIKCTKFGSVTCPTKLGSNKDVCKQGSSLQELSQYYCQVFSRPTTGYCRLSFCVSG